MHDCDDREQDLEEKIEIPDWSMAQYLILIWTMSVTVVDKDIKDYDTSDWPKACDIHMIEILDLDLNDGLVFDIYQYSTNL